MLGPPNVVLVCAAKELSASDRDLLRWINNKIRARTTQRLLPSKAGAKSPEETSASDRDLLSWINNKIRARPPPWTSRAPSAEALTKHTASVALQTKELSESDRDLLGWINNKIRARKSATASDFSGSIRNGHALVRLIEALTMADSGLSIRDFLGASHLTQLDLHRPAGPDTPDSKQGLLNFFFSHKPANQ
ncbi:hypothetical protein PtA15_4A597 [Puccinia triticina]|uniref:Calponin-homology (CH) domain-containing protein n=1 Tax=Puccinia triticina TaxID=208348 RepID=A0ABY7CJ50_9BASI|nr:uncharacterized protein PtA15_4A597 [Puccinia triticina]WAQ84146.1 hypothetical protein PtA15_4A597 [Puccinia triticina]